MTRFELLKQASITSAFEFMNFARNESHHESFTEACLLAMYRGSWTQSYIASDMGDASAIAKICVATLATPDARLGYATVST